MSQLIYGNTLKDQIVMGGSARLCRKQEYSILGGIDQQNLRLVPRISYQYLSIFAEVLRGRFDVY